MDGANNYKIGSACVKINDNTIREFKEFYNTIMNECTQIIHISRIGNMNNCFTEYFNQERFKESMNKFYEKKINNMMIIEKNTSLDDKIIFSKTLNSIIGNKIDLSNPRIEANFYKQPKGEYVDIDFSMNLPDMPDYAIRPINAKETKVKTTSNIQLFN